MTRATAVLLALLGANTASPRALADDPGQPLDAAVALARDAEVAAIGESHDNPAHHEIQTLIVERLVAGGDRPILAFEMLAEDQQGETDAAMQGGDGVADLARRLAWTDRGWPDFRMYYPLFDLARRHALPVLAADLNRAARRTIIRGGLGALAEPQRGLVASRLGADATREEALREELQTVHCGLLPPAMQASMADAWHARNVTMARRIAGALGRGRRVVLIAGRAHLAPHAVPGQLAAFRHGTRVRVIDLVENDGTPPLANADLVWPTPGVARPDRCAELRERPPEWRSEETR